MTVEEPRVRVPERGSTAVDPVTWRILRRSPAFWSLVDAKILSVEERSATTVRLLGGAHVGRVLIDGVLLELTEKVPGAAAALMGVAVPKLRTHALASPTTPVGHLVSVLVGAFLDEVRRYAGEGRDWRYVTRLETGSTITGSLDVRRTIALRAQGRRHQAAFRRSVTSRVTPLNTVLLAALREVDTIAALQPIPPADVAAARGLAGLFEDCLTPAVAFRSPTLVDAAATLVREAQPANADMVALAALLLAHHSLEIEDTRLGVAPVSWFVNLESLFERAVLEAVRLGVDPSVPVLKGGGFAQKVFPGTGTLAADPDIVIGSPPSLAVGDVKYKTWSGAAAASDLYQLLVHARTFGTTRAFLVYPSDGYEELRLGPSAVGSDVALVSLGVRNLQRDVNRLLSNIFA